jgi:hypothetical protein
MRKAGMSEGAYLPASSAVMVWRATPTLCELLLGHFAVFETQTANVIGNAPEPHLGFRAG